MLVNSEKGMRAGEMQRKLQISLILMLVLVTGAIVATALVKASHVRQEAFSALITQTTGRAGTDVREFFAPLSSSLRLLRRWGISADRQELSMQRVAERFIPILEETGLIAPVGEWILNEACSQMKAWAKWGYDPAPLAVNLSAHQFNQRDLADTIQRVLTSCHVDPNYLELELTETVIMRDAEVSRNTLLQLKDIGVRLSVDDFGTGYSSMSYLKLFPLRALGPLG